MRVPGQEPLSASMLAAAPLHEQKQMIGEWLVLLPRSRRGVRHQLTHQLEVSWGDQVPSLKLTRLLVTLSKAPLLPRLLFILKHWSDQAVRDFFQLCCSVTLTQAGRNPRCGEMGGGSSRG